jgi:hypothetical protein
MRGSATVRSWHLRPLSSGHHVLYDHVPADARRPQTPAVVVPVRRRGALAVSMLLRRRLQLLPARGGLLPLNLAAPCGGGCEVAAPWIVPGVRGSSHSHLQRDRQAIAAAWAGRAAVSYAPQVLPFQLQRTGHKTVDPARCRAADMSKSLRRCLCVRITWTLRKGPPLDAVDSGEFCVDSKRCVQCRKVRDTSRRSPMQRRSL